MLPVTWAGVPAEHDTPAGHAVHELPAREYCPTPHGAHVPPLTEDCPAGHFTHLDAILYVLPVINGEAAPDACDGFGP